MSLLFSVIITLISRIRQDHLRRFCPKTERRNWNIKLKSPPVFSLRPTAAANATFEICRDSWLPLLYVYSNLSKQPRQVVLNMTEAYLALHLLRLKLLGFFFKIICQRGTFSLFWGKFTAASQKQRNVSQDLMIALCFSLPSSISSFCLVSDPNALGQHGPDHALIGGVVAVVVFITLCLIIVLGRYLARHKGKRGAATFPLLFLPWDVFVLKW